MALQIRRGTQAERGTLTTGNGLVAGEPLYVTDDQKLYIGDGTTPGGIAVTDFNATDAVNVIGTALENGVHTGISFSYNFGGAGGSARINGTVSQNITALSDVTITGTPSDGQVLKWDTATSQWINGAAPASTLDGLSDVIITGTPSTGEVVRYNGSNWVNSSSSLDELSDVVITGSMTEGLVLRHNGTNWVASDALTDESIQDTVAGVLTRGVHTGISFTYQDGSNRLDAIVGFTEVNDDATPSLGGNLSLNSNNITGTGNINITGDVTATRLIGNVTTSAGTVLVNASNRSATFANLNIEASGSISGTSILVNSPSITFVTSTVGDSPFANFLTASSTGAITSPIGLVRSRGTLISPSAVESGDQISSIASSGFSGSAFTLAAEINSVVDGTVSAGVVPSRIDVTVTNAAGVRATKMSVKAAAVEFTAPPRLPVVADDAARSTLVPTPSKGMMIFIESGTTPAATNTAQVYNGTAWVNLA